MCSVAAATPPRQTILQTSRAPALCLRVAPCWCEIKYPQSFMGHAVQCIVAFSFHGKPHANMSAVIRAAKQWESVTCCAQDLSFKWPVQQAKLNTGPHDGNPCEYMLEASVETEVILCRCMFNLGAPCDNYVFDCACGSTTCPCACGPNAIETELRSKTLGTLPKPLARNLPKPKSAGCEAKAWATSWLS
jgi:hypothetical protein